VNKAAILGRKVQLELRLSAQLKVYELCAEWRGPLDPETGMSVQLPQVDDLLLRTCSELKKINFTEMNHALEWAAKVLEGSSSELHSLSIARGDEVWRWRLSPSHVQRSEIEVRLGSKNQFVSTHCYLLLREAQAPKLSSLVFEFQDLEAMVSDFANDPHNVEVISATTNQSWHFRS
jgi:hypothetical protein